MAFQFSGTVIIPAVEFFAFIQGQQTEADSDVIYALDKSYIRKLDQSLVLVAEDNRNPGFVLDLVDFWSETICYHPDFKDSTFYGVPYLLSGDIAVDMVASTTSHEVMVDEIGASLKKQWLNASRYQDEDVFFLA